MTSGEVVALMRHVFGGNVLLTTDQIDQLRRLLEVHEAFVRQECARIAEANMEDSVEAALIAAAIREETT